jgi:L-ascorbate metabolism protein UlaG (beta-lactamase superfamily)
MQPQLIARPFQVSLAEELAKPRRNGMTLYWLGQAGFVIDTPALRVVIDPYLSDALAAKYRDTEFPHARMAAAPLAPDELGTVDLVLCTHHHTDHLDGDTLRPLAERLPELRFVVPAAAMEVARQRTGVVLDRLIGVDAFQTLSPLPGLAITVMRAAHETIERDADGRHRFLGYGLNISQHRIFHSGDTIPFAGQSGEISAFAPHIALLPVNGRSARLHAAGFAGNLSLAEAIALVTQCGVPAMIAHHYGMFAFNSADPHEIDEAAATAPFQMLRARFQMAFELGKE